MRAQGFPWWAFDSVLEEVQYRGTLRVGLGLFEPWSACYADGELIGFEIDIATRVAEDIVVEVEFLRTDWSYILSVGWGLIRADFLTPNYDITFSKARNVAPFKRRRHQDTYEDFQLPSSAAESIVFFGCRDYIPLFRKLTAKTKGNRTVFYAGRGLDVPDCTLRRFGDPFTNWHYQCAQAFVEDRLEH